MPPNADLRPDRDATLAFLKWHTRRWHDLPEPARLELRALCPDKERSPVVTAYALTDSGLHEAARQAEELNARNRGLYYMVNPKRATVATPATDADIIAAVACFADCDTADAAKAVAEFAGVKYSHVVRTGVTAGDEPFPRVHAYWELEDFETDLDAWRETQRAIAARFGSDPVINPSRIMRLPGTINWPSRDKAAKGYAPELVLYKTDIAPPVSFERMQRIFPAATPQTLTEPHRGGVEAGGVFSGIDLGTGGLDAHAARDAAMSGEQWHNHVIRLVGQYVARGMSDEEIYTLTDPLTLPGYTVEQTRREVGQAIYGARKKGWAPSSTVPELAIAETVSEPAAIEVDIDGDISEAIWAEALRMPRDTAEQRTALDGFLRAKLGAIKNEALRGHVAAIIRDRRRDLLRGADRAIPAEHAGFFGSFADLPPEEAPASMAGNWLRQRSYSLLYSRAGVGKTVWLSDLLYCIKTGQRFMSDETESLGPVLWVNGDMPGWQVHERLGFLAGHADLWHCPMLDMMAAKDLLKERAKDYAMIILDNRSCLFQLEDSNKAEAWTPLNDLMREVADSGPAVILATHEGKGEGTSSFGSSAQEWFADNIIRLSKFDGEAWAKKAEKDKSKTTDPATIEAMKMADRKAVFQKARLSAEPEDAHFFITPRPRNIGDPPRGLKCEWCD